MTVGSPLNSGDAHPPDTAENPVDVLRRWEDFGAVWEVVDRGEFGVTVSLCRCDGGEEVQRLTSADPELLTFLASRDTVGPPTSPRELSQ